MSAPESTVQALDAANHLARELERWKRKARRLGEHMQILRGLLTGMVFDYPGSRITYPKAQERAAGMVKMGVRRRKPW